MVIAGSVFGGGYSLTELASARTKSGEAKAKLQDGAWRSIVRSGFLIGISGSQLLHGTVSWVILGLALCLLSASLTMEVRSLRNA
jgi:hypothetical protein